MFNGYRWCTYRPETKSYAYVPTFSECFNAGPSGGNFLVPARKLIRSRLKGRCRKAAPLRIPRPHRRRCGGTFWITVDAFIGRFSDKLSAHCHIVECVILTIRVTQTELLFFVHIVNLFRIRPGGLTDGQKRIILIGKRETFPISKIPLEPYQIYG